MVQAGQARFWRSSRGLTALAAGGTQTPTIESQMASGSVSLATLTSDGSPLQA
jgi:hypothetical protein